MTTHNLFAIRPYHPSDLPALYRICLQTADVGHDASHLYRDPDLIGHYYVGPYAIAEPDLAFVLTHQHRPVGYVIAARDTAAFGAWCERDWFPPLREQYPRQSTADRTSQEQWIIEAIHRGQDQENRWPRFPAHLHIDILPEGQGGGFGRGLMERLWARLIELEVPGVHLGVGGNNTRAVDFYRHIGFEELEAHEWGFTLGKRFE